MLICVDLDGTLLDTVPANAASYRAALEEHDVKLFLDIDRDFHIAVAEATNNETLISISNDLLKRADVHMWRRYKEDLRLLEKTVEAHRFILNAIKERNPTKASFYSEKHLARCV